MARATLVLILAIAVVGPAVGFEFHIVKDYLIKRASSFVGKHKNQPFPTEDSILNSGFECENDGLFPNPEECKSYIRCWNRQAYTQMCQDSLHFSSEAQRCVAPCDAHCDQTLAHDCVLKNSPASFVRKPKNQPFPTEDSILNSGFECENDGLFPNPEKCKSYIQCSNGQAYTQLCQDSLHFSSEAQRCVAPCDAHCDQTLAHECVLKNTPESSSSEKFWPTWFPPYTPRPPARKGPCNGNYYCDSETQTCKPYTHGDCQENENNFKDEEACSLACGSPSEESSSSVKAWPTLFPPWVPPYIPPVQKGPCNGNYYCDSETQTCKPYTHGDCQENENNFEDEDACSLACGSPAEKSSSSGKFWPTWFPPYTPRPPAKKGPCNGNYYCDSKSQTCKPYTHGDCQENENNFKDEEACSLACGSPSEVSSRNDDGQQSTGNFRPYRFTCVEGERYPYFIRECGRYMQCTEGSIVGLACPEGLHFSPVTKKCEKPCDAYCDPTIAERCQWIPPEPDWTRPSFVENHKAEQFPTEEPILNSKFECDKDGLFPNPQECKSYIQCSNGQAYTQMCQDSLHFSSGTQRCEHSCKARCDPTIAEKCAWTTFDPDWKRYEDVCRLPYEKGPCDALRPRFFFDPITGACHPFLYGGCRGNANNFRTLEDCETRCLRENDSPSPYSTKYAVRDDEFTCIKDGQYQNPEGCNSYIQCSNGNPSVIPCPQGLHFSKETEKCESPCDAQCDSSIAEECGWDQNIETTFDHVCTLPWDFGTCGLYIHRFFFDTVTWRCRRFLWSGCDGNANRFRSLEACRERCTPPEGSKSRYATKYSVQNDETTWDENTETTITQTEQTSTEDSQSIFSQPGKSTAFYRGNQLPTDYSFTSPKSPYVGDGLYPDPEDCSRFIQYAKGETYPLPCPYGLHFNEMTQRCETPCDARCNMTIACQCGWPECSDLEVDCETEPLTGPCRESTHRYYYDRDSGKCRRFTYGGCGGNTNNFISERECKQKCQQKLLGGYRCPSTNGKFADIFDCISYYDCKRGKPTLKRCSRGKAFDHLKSTCLSEEETTCLFVCRDRNAVYSYPIDCHKYIDCVNGIAKVERCPYGEAFDRRKKQCVDEKTVICPGS